MANKQPFYHRLTVLFTATDDVSYRMKAFMKQKLPEFDEVIPDSIEIEECDAEPGDPADLM